jgi:septal ring factor EnvC (AmiA/AmiB activator)
MSKDSPNTVPRPHELQFCCGTSCDAQANLAYVKQLEAEHIDLEDRNLHLVKSICHANDRNTNLQDEIVLLKRGIEAIVDELIETHAKCTERGMTIKARDRALRMLQGEQRGRDRTMIHPDHMG